MKMEIPMKRLTVFTAAVFSAALVATSALAWTGVATGNVNLRDEDSIRGTRLTTIPEGALVEVYGCPTWCHLTYRGITGWASSSYIAPARHARGPRVYYERPRVYYYRERPPFWYGRPHPWRGPWRYRRWHRPGFGIYFGF